MTTSLYALTAALMIYTWQSDPLLTYTVQRSLDLENWETLPLVVSGSAGLEEVGIELGEWPVFVRLRSSESGDTNQNGLPDEWEWERFGHVEVEAWADPDLDGMTNLEEWEGGTDPLDFFNGERPRLILCGGREWLVAGGEVSSQALVVALHRADGDPWPGAPVRVRTLSGNPAIVHAGDPPGEALAECVEWTDALGRLNPGIHALHLLGPGEAGASETVLIEAGAATESLTVVGVGDDFGGPPRGLEWSMGPEGVLECSWSGEPGTATGFLVEEQGNCGQWIRLAAVPVGQLAPADPDTGRYHLAMNGH